MKNVIKIVLIPFTLVLLNACSLSLDEVQRDAAYYTFNNQDTAFIINYKYVQDQIITYINEEGETLRFKVLENETKKRTYRSRGTFSGGDGLLENYYDCKIIRFEIIENPSSEQYAMVNYIFSKNKNILTNGLNLPMWNVPVYSYIDEHQNCVNIFLKEYTTVPTSSLTINGHLFNKVITINSNSDQNNTNNLFGPLTQNINQLKYDYDFGIIQFKDIDGRLWSVVYPE